MNTDLIEEWDDILPLYPNTRIVRDGSADAAPDFVWQTLHQIARAIDGTDYPAFSLTYKRMGERPDVANYNAFAGRAHVPDDADTGLIKGHIWINQWGCEPEAEPKYTATLLHEYTHLHVDRRLGRQGHNKHFYRHLYRFAQRGIVRGLSVREQWRKECHHIDRKARITASEVAATEFGLENAKRSLRQRKQRERRAASRDSAGIGSGS